MLGKAIKKGRIHYAWFVLLGCCLMQIGSLGALGYTVGIYYTPVTEALGVGRGTFAFASTIQGCFMAFCTPIAGKLCSKKHFGAQIACAMAVLVLMYSSYSRLTAVWQWYILAPLMGFCASFIYLLPMPILINNWFEKKTGLAMGIAALCSGLGGAIMTPVGTGFLLEYGWRGTYWRMGAIAALIVIPAALLLIQYSPSQLGMQPYGHEETAGVAVQGAELRGIPAKTALKSRAFLYVFLTAGLVSFTAGYSAHYVAFANSLGMPAMVGAVLASTMMVGTIGMKLLLGWLNDKLKVKKATWVALMMVSASYLCVVTFNRVLPLLYTATFIAGMGQAMMALTPSLLTRTAFGTREYSRIFSYTTIASSLVSALSNSILGFIYDFTGSYTYAFLLGVVVATTAAVTLTLALHHAEKLRLAVAGRHE